MASEVRIDKWLWAVRLYKTRSIAADACKKGHISMNGVNLKPARTIKVGDVVQVRKSPITLSLKVLQAIENRVSAKLVPEMLQDVTPPEQYELLEMSKISGFVDRAKGTGRPTKKERRSLESFFEADDDDLFWEED
ncbi:MAG: RNA-binding S4 domain-containing protein [Bacteroidales bacterium]|nr:RNA-binding S4 domain-containing protein [Bacteroidales bacterium]